MMAGTAGSGQLAADRTASCHLRSARCPLPAARCLFPILLAAVCLLLCAPADAEAARLAISLVGGLAGAFFGPMGFSLGFAAGGLLGNILFPDKQPTQRGPRIEDKSVQSAAHGAHITKHWGTYRLAAQLIFSSGLKQKKHTISGGKGGFFASPSGVYYTYSVDLMLSFGRRAKNVLRIWADTKLIYDITGQADIKKKWRKEGRKFVVRAGNETQQPSALEESYHGQSTAHRGLFCLEARDFQLASFLNRVPNFTAEVATDFDDDFGKIASYTPPAPPYSFWLHSFGYMDPNGEILAMYYPSSTRWPYPGYARIFHWALDRPSAPEEEYHPLWSAEPVIVQESSTASYVRVRSDEHSSAAFGTNDQGVALSYFRLEDGTRLDILTSESSGKSSPEILVKYGDEIYVLFQIGTPPAYLIKYSAITGLKLAESGIVNSTLGVSGVADMGRSESYLWVMSANRLLKIDPDSFALLANLPITGTIGNLLGMYVASDTEIRVFTADSGGTRFYVVDPATGAATLDKHDPDETYASWRAFGRWGLRYFDDIYVVDFGGYTGGFGALIDFFGDGGSAPKIPHWKIVRDINVMAGLDSKVDSVPPTVGDIEVSELTDLEHGYAITRPMTAREAIFQLQQCRFYDVRDSDLKLRYVKRGKAPVKSLPGAELAVRSSLSETLPDRLTQTRARETELPLRVHIIHVNPLNAYQPGHEYAPRLITSARATLTVNVALALEPAEARQIADAQLAVAWLERETFEAKASRKHMRLDAADNVEVVITEE